MSRALEYTPGPWLALLRADRVLIVPGETAPATVRSLWDALATAPGLEQVLQALLRAHDMDLGRLCPFALATLAPDAQVLLRGPVALHAAGPAGDTHVDGAGVGTWTERRLTGQRTLVLGPLPLPLPAPELDAASGTWWPQREGIVLVGGIRVELTATDTDADSAGASALVTVLDPEPTVEPVPTVKLEPTVEPESPVAPETVADPDPDSEPETPVEPETAALPFSDPDIEPTVEAASAGAPEPVIEPEPETSVELAEPSDEPTLRSLPPMPTPDTPAPSVPAGVGDTVIPDSYEIYDTSSHELVDLAALMEPRPPGDNKPTNAADAAGDTHHDAADADASRMVSAHVAEAEDTIISARVTPPAPAPTAASQEPDPDPDDMDTILGSAVRRGQSAGAALPPVPSAAIPEPASTPGSRNGASQPPARPTAPVPGLIDSTPWTGPKPAAEAAAAVSAAPQPPAVAHGDHDGDTLLRIDLPGKKTQPGSAAAAAPAGSAGLDTGPLVISRTCASGHANPPTAARCSRCALVLDTEAEETARPPLGRIILSDGQRIDLDRSVVIGRQPSSPRASSGSMPRMLQVKSPMGDISRSHLEVRLDGWHVLLVDLNATNGTRLLRPGAAPRRLGTGESVMVFAGDTADLGDGVSLRFEGQP